jgi:hypothetical protein
VDSQKAALDKDDGAVEAHDNLGENSTKFRPLVREEGLDITKPLQKREGKVLSSLH